MSKNNHFTSVEQILSYAVATQDGCMEWQRAKSKDGYGMVWYQGKVITTNRLVLILKLGLPEVKSVAMHLCDNPPCINPDHLRWGTHAENSQDMVAKNRRKSTPITGVRHHNAKLNPQFAFTIRAAYKQGFTQKELASAYGVSKTTIGNIVKNKIWK